MTDTEDDRLKPVKYTDVLYAVIAGANYCHRCFELSTE
ncbi:hypothetical protein XMA121_000485 [Marinobacterium sp. xm-a-121]|nr:hypothetical protein [Marinobacterium sp. xm-g-48]NRP16544.1 hypothetical protein [Marinobacterium sp. xm-a-152]NRP28463.1 hypothetical protein [Marinobacterium sp. xm-d-420]NRP35369.1 hypothetical protein [Marinobacterium sp. xm-d-579]NRP37893.1 hypothetical protein [Marinobacterium sp. xm-a-121]NRP46334.1 hypothetical protein [Marinobacterium sp. xm-d-543]NRP52688.1 hypothetical protein [Marinobacterium sp. xm-v-242]NRP56283.1 hypothetical protein [Marinobacterium sp. xm-d-510]NRP58730